MSSVVIADALIKYDTAQEVTNYLIKNATPRFEATKSELKRAKIWFDSKTTKEVMLESEIEIIGTYYDKYDIWIWSWAQPQLIKPYAYMTKKALQYALDLEPDKIYLKSILSLSRGVVSHPIQVDINIAICTYLIKQPYVYPISQKIGEHTVTQYIIMLNKNKLSELGEKIKDN